MLNPEYEDIPDIHQRVERAFGQIGNQIREDFQRLGSRRFWADLMTPQMFGACTILYGDIRWMVSMRDASLLGTVEGVGIMALGAIILYRYRPNLDRPKWWKLAE